MLTHNYSYKSCLDASEKINWTLDDVLAGKSLDFTRPFLPESLAGVSGIRCLDAKEKLTLNHIRGFTYLYLFGLVEEYIQPSVMEQASTATGDDYETRALLRFAEEEAKHIQMFKWFVAEFERGFGTPCGVIGPPKQIAAAILNHSRLGVFITTLHLEWFTQKHYVDSVRDNGEGLDPLFASMLKHHWMEEAQHAKLDTLVIDKMVSALDGARIEAGIDDYMSIGKLLDGGLTAQVALDLESLERATGRTFTAEERAEITAAQTRAYRETFLLSGIRHPNFDRSLRELSTDGHARVAQLAAAIS